MRKFSLLIALILSIGLITPVLAQLPGGGSGGLPSASLWKKLSATAVGTTPDSLDIGTSGTPVGDIYAGALTISGITLTGNLDLGANDILQVDSIFGSTSILPVRIGDGATTSHSLDAEDDLLVTGELEVDGTGYFDSNLNIASGKELIMSAGSAVLEPSTSRDQFVFEAGSGVGRNFVFTSLDTNKDFDHSTSTNASLFVHSATDPDSDNQQYLHLTHDQTAGLLTSKTGALALRGALGAYTVVIDDYTSCALDTITVTVTTSGGDTATPLVEGTDWDDATGNNETATSLASAIDALAGVGAAAVTDTVTMTYIDTTLDIQLSSASDCLTESNPDDSSILGNGSKSTVPAFSFYNDTDTGFGRNSANAVNFIVGGVARMQLTTGLSSYIGVDLNMDSASKRIYNDKGDLMLGNTCDAAGTTGNVCVGGAKFTADNTSQFDGTATFTSGITQSQDQAIVSSASNGITLQLRDTTQTVDTGALLTGATANSILIAEYADVISSSVDYKHAQATYPTVWQQSDDGDNIKEYLGWWHDGDDATWTVGKGGYSFEVVAQSAEGTLTLAGGVPTAEETFDVNNTTFTAKASGAGTDEFNIGDAATTITNIAAMLNAGTEAANLTAWDGAGDTVVIQWGTAGTAGNAIVFTEAMTNTTIDGAGTLGTTHAGVAASTPLTIGEDTATTFGGIVELNDERLHISTLAGDSDTYIASSGGNDRLVLTVGNVAINILEGATDSADWKSFYLYSSAQGLNLGASCDAAGSTGNVCIGGALLTVDNDVQFDGDMIYTVSSVTTLAAGNTLTVAEPIELVDGDSGAVTLTSTPNIANGTVGQCVTIMGDDGTNTVTFQDADNLGSSGLALAGDVNAQLGVGDSLRLCYTTVNSVTLWREQYRNLSIDD